MADGVCTEEEETATSHSTRQRVEGYAKTPGARASDEGYYYSCSFVVVGWLSCVYVDVMCDVGGIKSGFDEEGEKN